MTMIHGDGFDVEVIRSPRRRTLSLQIKDGQVIIRMPKRASIDHARFFVRSKTRWIQQKLAASPTLPPRRYQDGETVLFLGQTLTFELLAHQTSNQIDITAQQLRLSRRDAADDVSSIERQLRRWYRQQAQQLLLARTQQLAQRCELFPTEVTIKTYKARWGSCRLDGQIQLNWKLIMAPQAIIDYVIIHELCHLRQHNHSPAFWRLVQLHDPDFKQHRSWLKTFGYQLTL